MINVDGAIQLLMTTNTPQARKLRQAFRRKLAEMRLREDLSPEKQREEALFNAIADLGAKVNDMGTLSGSMDE